MTLSNSAQQLSSSKIMGKKWAKRGAGGDRFKTGNCKGITMGC